MKILLTNDDGIDAEGINALKNRLRTLHDVVVVAPDGERSECGHSVTTRRPLCVEQRADSEYCVDGTPVDCVRIGLCELVKDATIVVAGINHGGNLGGETWVSGTVAAAREGWLRGVNSLAVSQYRRPDIELDWEGAAIFAADAIEQAIKWSGTELKLWNVNLPATSGGLVPEIRRCKADALPLPVDYERTQGRYQYRSSYHDRPRTQGADTDVCFGGRISISSLDDHAPEQRPC